MVRLLGLILLVIGLLMVGSIIFAAVGLWFMLFGVLLLIFGGGRRVVEVHHHHDEYEPPRRREKVIKAKVIEAPPAPVRKLRADAAEDFTSAVLLYQRHAGFADPGDAIRTLAADALRREGFLR